MLQYLVRRVLWAILLFFVVTIVTYVIFYVTPSNPARLAAGQGATPQQVEAVKERLHLNDPLYQQYGIFIKNLVVHQSLGDSFVNRRSVNSLVVSAAPVTAALVVGGALFWLALSLPVGVLSAVKRGSLLDRGATVFVLIGIAAHPVWIGLILLFVFGFKLGLFPIGGYCDFFNPSLGSECGGPVQWAHHLVLPWGTFMLLFAALYVRLIRANVLETMNEDYVRTARAKGASRGRVMRSHILRNSMLPVVTILGMDIGGALGGAIFTESIYNLPGMGRQILRSISNFDLPVIMGTVVFAMICIIVLNLVVDIVYAWIDPRIRLS